MLVSREDLVTKIRGIFPFFMSDRKLIEKMIAHCEVVIFEPGKMIFKEDAKAEHIYFIVEGEVEILKERHQSLNVINNKAKGGIFGEDALGNEAKRRTSARAKSTSLLVRIPINQLQMLISHENKLQRAFSLIITTYNNLLKSYLSVEYLQESVVYFGYSDSTVWLLSSSLKLFFWIVFEMAVWILLKSALLSIDIFTVFSLFFSGVVLLWLLWNYFDWRNDKYIVTSRRVVNRKQTLFFKDQCFETPLNKIININIQKSIWGRSLDFGNMFIKTFTDVSWLKNIPQADIVQSLIENLWEKEKEKAREEEKRTFETVLQDQSNANLDRTVSPFSDEEEMTNEFINEEIIEDRGNIYKEIHTHWILLLGKFIFPSMLLFSSVLILIYMKLNTFQLLESPLSIILASLYFCVVIIWCSYQFADWQNDRYIIDNQNIIDINRKPFGLEDRRTAPIKNIQSIRYEKRGLIRLLFDFGTVYIRVGDEDFTFDEVHNPAGIQKEIFNAFIKLIENESKEELTEQQKRFIDWMDSYEKFKGERKSKED